MDEGKRFYLIAEEGLPDVFRKVLQAKMYLENGTAKNIGDATAKAGVSRSAFYKYRNMVRPFEDRSGSKIMTFHSLLLDTPGVLSEILQVFAGSSANILSINQNIPTAGRASCTICAETSNMKVSVHELISRASNCKGVIRFEVEAG